MSNNPYNLATPLAENPYFTAFVRVVREELEKIDPEKLLVYMFDTVDASLLDILAEQFDMLGYNGWILATTDAQKRELLKDSARLHDLQGHPAGIREVALRLGFKDVIIEENSGAPEGAENPWAYFNVKYVLADDRAIDLATPAHLVNMIDVYKGMRNLLGDLSLVIPKEEKAMVEGIVTLRVLDAATDAVISEDVSNNLITGSGLYWLARGIGARFTGDVVVGRETLRKVRFSSYAGTYNGNTPLATITSIIEKDLLHSPADSSSSGLWRFEVFIDASGTEMTIRHWFELGASEGNGSTIRTLGLISVDENPDTFETPALFAINRRAPIVKTSLIKIEGTWDIIIRNQV